MTNLELKQKANEVRKGIVTSVHVHKAKKACKWGKNAQTDMLLT